MDSSETLIDLIRHGEPEGGRMFRGVTDHPLSDRGWAQMRLATAGEAGWQAVVTSPLVRCAGFAEVLAETRALPLEPEPGLREMDFGAWEGRTASDILANGPGDLGAFWADPERAAAPGGEALADFRERVVAAWEELMARHAGRHVLVVGHGGAIRVILAHVLGMPLANLFRMEVAYAGRSRIRSDDAGTRLVAHGSHE
ncbi:MAG TPA: histidine phosphatase family protein [Gammaproteobacteria bacterium]|nr:histidine phosphatase family protein [Gammaproteobacteria bacterium]